MKLTVEITKKVGLPGFGSLGVGAGLEFTAKDGQDPAESYDKAYTAVEKAVKKELDKLLSLEPGSHTDGKSPQSQPAQQQRPPAQQPQTPDHGSGAGGHGEWRGVMIHFGKKKGLTLGELSDRKSLSWWQNKWQLKEDGEYPPTDQDRALRAALDASMGKTPAASQSQGSTADAGQPGLHEHAAAASAAAAAAADADAAVPWTPF